MYSDLLKQVRTAVYDTLYLPSQLSQKRANAFCEPQGVGIFTKNGRTTKTFNDTNMVMPGCLPMPQSFAVERISCYFIGQTGILPIRSRWYAEASLQFRLLGKNMAEGPLAEFAGHAAIFADNNHDVKGMSPVDLENYKDSQIKKRFDPPIIIDKQAYFSATVEFSDWADGDFGMYPDKLVISLWGTLFLPVQ